MLTGQAKKDYQRKYMREWQRVRRGSKQTDVAKQIDGSKQVDRSKQIISSISVVEPWVGALSKQRQVSPLAATKTEALISKS
jgi:hypothetical protein